MPKGNPLVPILASGAVAGTLDITSAFILSGWGVCRFIAAGLLGPEARHGGIGIWLLGLFLHYFIATSIAAVYCLSSRRLAFLVSHYLISGLFYGMAAYLVMNLIVLPLSALHAQGPYHIEGLIRGLIIHMLLIGVPIGFVNARLSR
jgi:hypothetical protein